MTRFQRFLLLYAIFNLCLLCCACGDWTSQASSIIGLLVPAIQSALAILVAFGVGISPTALEAVQKWAADAQDALLNVIKPALAAYDAVAGAAKAQILTQIEAALNSIVSNLATALADVQVTDPATQSKITLIFGLISSWLQALINLIPAIQGTVPHEKARELFGAVKTTDEFKAEFNLAVEGFGNQYELK